MIYLMKMNHHIGFIVDSSTKLLPTFYQTLQNLKNNTYQEVLDLLQKKSELSDDNDKWIDKHSGYIIKFIEFDDSEIDDGYKIVSQRLY